ncbi:MAG: glycogen debranching enzyme N-terminal domain-containing protein [Chloroflexi bacterium]|nr:glycogen debranching enzyme N-terminal domain-containing protein [Chloroflexota bacterium]
MFDYERSLCAELMVAGTREWLVTNGIGGFACGTIAGILTRRYHGLLVAALKAPVGRMLLVTKLDATAEYDGRAYPLYADRFDDGAVFPKGFKHLERFHLEGAIPVWSYACADALLEKRIWMQPGANTTYVRYTLRRGTKPLSLMLTTLVNYRDHHVLTHHGFERMHLHAIPQGVRVLPFEGATPYTIRSDRGHCELYGDWLTGYFLSVEHFRGYDTTEDHFHAASFNIELQAGESVTIVASSEEAPNLNGDSALAERQAYERALIEQSGDTQSEPFVQQLVLAADQFIVKRALPDDPDGRSVIAGYPWFSDWGRDTMISLPGLALATRRYDVAQRILRTFAHFISEGMLPNRFPDAGEAPEYNTADATLWYFEAIRAYHAATGDDDLLRALFPALAQIIQAHHSGTRYNIKVDAEDGLLYAGAPGVQLTWMDAKVGEWVVTPRIGKPVEINALWYNGLCIMADFAQRLGKNPAAYQEAAARVKASFMRFWFTSGSYCYDVIGGPEGHDLSLRPNQLFAVSLPHSPLSWEKQKAVVDACALHLLTTHGLRSLAPDDPAYIGHYGGDLIARDGAYHQGTVWSWLIGPFASAHLRVYGDKAQARSYLMGLVRHMAGDCVGSINEIFDGDPPHAPRGCFAQAWAVAEVLRVWRETEP